MLFINLCLTNSSFFKNILLVKVKIGLNARENMINHVIYVLLLGVSLLLGSVLIGKYMARLFEGNNVKLI